MASTTLTMTKGTWIAPNNTSTHASETYMRTSFGPYTNEKGGVNQYCQTAVVQFTIPNTLKYKLFKSAVLRFYTSVGQSGGFTKGYGADFTPFVTGDTLASLTYGNLSSYGEVGQRERLEAYSEWNMQSFPRWREIDITSLFLNNIYNDTYFTIMINAWPGTSTYDSTHYANIDNVGGSNPCQLVLTYEDQTQPAPTPSYPNGTYVNENTDLMFAWAWNSNTAAVQASVQLEYKLKTAGSYTVVSLTQTTHTYTLVGGLPQGTYQWRIKGTNDASETSAYSDVAEFNVVGKPSVPVINAVPNRTLTEITWNTTDQNAYDITLTDSNGKYLINESVASSVSSYKPNMFLKGTYTVAIRTRNSTGLTSDWSYKTFSITASGPAKPTMRLAQNDVKATITVQRADGINYAIIRKVDRENESEKILGLIASSNSFVEKTFGFDIPYRYVVRAYSTGGYTDSDPERICYSKSAIVLETEEDEIVIDRSEETFFPYSEDVAGDLAVFNCVGRELPVAEHGEFESRAFRSRLYIRENQKEKLVAMAKKNKIFYRDYSGRAFPVVINPPINFSRYMNNGYLVDIEFVRISEQEVIVNV
jgi:hypothetical protein